MANVSDVYTIYANTGQLDDASRKLSQFRNQVESTGGSMGRLQGDGGKGAQGILMLSQTIDDAQYGFRSIVNNIPAMGQALGEKLGMGTDNAMKFAGAMGLLAVAINLNLKHMEEWKALGTGIIEDAFGKGSVETITDKLWGMAGALNSVVETVSGGTLSFSMEETARNAEEKQRKAKELATGTKAFEAAQKDIDEEAQARGKAFAAAVKGTEGGGKGITGQLADIFMESLGMSKEDARAKAGNVYAGALAGNERDIKQIAGMLDSAGFNARYEAATPEGMERQKKREEESAERAKEAKELQALEDKEWEEIVAMPEKTGKQAARALEKARKEEEKRLEQLPDALLDVPEKELALGRARMNLAEKLYGGPADRIGATDFARTAEGKGADMGRQTLEKMDAQLEVQRATLNVLQAQDRLAVLSK